MSLSYDEIADILKIIDSSSCDEVVIETGGVKLVVRRNGAAGAPAVQMPLAPAREVPRPVVPQPANDAAAKPATPAVKPVAGGLEVAAPMVGTFYRASSPDAPPFVEVGSIVTVGQPLCLIEVMKLFTTINSDFAGRVVQIGAENGELVEYGRTLFVIEPT
ncbi:MAG TPA: acetyl-CoA carboxylase biotin carboxyl carrier protein [Pseudolabrys sp.]|nr:acetyl-CoA carboxylase biotin carboxyl carrier protein [Pseudolabrys sp.]